MVSEASLRNGVDSKTQASLTCIALAKVARKTTPLVVHRCREQGQRDLSPHCAQGMERRWGTTGDWRQEALTRRLSSSRRVFCSPVSKSYTIRLI